MDKFRKWLIKRLVGETPVIMNVTLVLDKPILGQKSDGILEKSYIQYTNKCLEELGHESKN